LCEALAAKEARETSYWLRLVRNNGQFAISSSDFGHQKKQKLLPAFS